MNFGLINILYLAFLFLFTTISLLYVKQKKTATVTIILFLLLIGLFTGLYIREVVYSNEILASTDEANYFMKYYECQYNSDCMVSGAGYVDLIKIFYEFFPGIQSNGLFLFSIIITTLYLPLLYLIFNLILKDQFLAYFSAILLLTTNYFIFPIVEGRPQQIGMFLTLVAVYYFNYFFLEESNTSSKLIFFGILGLVFYVHLLSFFITLLILVALIGSHYLNGKDYIKESAFLFVSSLVYLILFGIGLGPYASMGKGIKFALGGSSNILIQLVSDFSPFSYLLIYGFAFVTFLALIIGLRSPYLKLKNIIIKKVSQKKLEIFALLIYLVLVVGFVQYILRADVYSVVYNNSLLLFLFFQVGNAVFAILYILALLNITSKKKSKLDLSFFWYASLSLAIIGFGGLILSVVLPVNFDNWALRIINYFVIFSAPLVGGYVLSISNKKRLLLPLFLLLLIPGLILASKDPFFFDSKNSWDNTDVASMAYLASEDQSGNTYYVSTEDSGYMSNNYEKLHKLESFLLFGEQDSITIIHVTEDLEYGNKIYSSTGWQIYK
jgi:hypothetical protein